jgi:polyisoprenoid-binding protein YceI
MSLEIGCMKTSTIVLSVVAVLGGVGAVAAWRGMDCSSCKVAATTPAAVVTTVANPAPAASGAFTVDAVHSGVLFRIKHMGVSYFHGRFNDFSGTFHLDGDDAAKSALNVTVKADSIDTGNAGREKHLKSADFFSTAEFPEITFTSTSVKKTGDHTYDVTGDLTMLGAKKSVTATVTHVGTAQAPAQMGGGEVSGVEATFTIKRSDFGMNYGIDKGALSDEVQMTIALEGKRK